jgi:DNA-binding response OmpR family regulator
MKTVLVVEDDPGIRNLVASRLQEHGYEITLAVTAEDALKKAESADVILLDLMLPGMSGGALLTEMRKQKTYVPVIIVSATPEREGRKNINGTFVEGYIQKPFKFEVLLEHVKVAAGLKEGLQKIDDAGERIANIHEEQKEITERQEKIKVEQEELDYLCRSQDDDTKILERSQ